MDLADERIASAAIESMRRTVLRDRNCPAVFAWLIYNECNPHPGYAKRIADTIRGLDRSGRPIGMADCSRQVDRVKEMVEVGGLSLYGINHYNSDVQAYLEIMESYPDLPLVITEWGGRVGQGNPRILAELCATFAHHAGEGPAARIAGSCFWVWQDYPEHTRAEPATIDGWTIEGLIDRQARPRQDLLALSMMCFEIDHPPVREAGQPRVLLPVPRRAETWESVDLERITGDQAALEQEIEQERAVHGVRAPVLGPVLVDGIEFTPRHAERPAAPLLIGRGREEAVISINRTVRAIAVLGHVDFRAGYPGSGLFSVHTGGGAGGAHARSAGVRVPVRIRRRHRGGAAQTRRAHPQGQRHLQVVAIRSPRSVHSGCHRGDPAPVLRDPAHRPLGETIRAAAAPAPDSLETPGPGVDPGDVRDQRRDRVKPKRPPAKPEGGVPDETKSTALRVPGRSVGHRRGQTAAELDRAIGGARAGADRLPGAGGVVGAPLAADDGDRWDSGKVGSDATLHVAYDGKPLGSRDRCHWKVRVWDRTGRASPWSRPATWTMGLLAAADWGAQWIARDDSPRPAPVAPRHGFLTRLSPSPDIPKSVTLDLGAAAEIDAVRLHPAAPLGTRPGAPSYTSVWEPGMAGVPVPGAVHHRGGAAGRLLRRGDRGRQERCRPAEPRK